MIVTGASISRAPSTWNGPASTLIVEPGLALDSASASSSVQVVDDAPGQSVVAVPTVGAPLSVVDVT